ncbi:MAG: hypothetical protein ACMXYK_01370 [Candidatus Woesearchaeota archaeon]
MDLTLPKSMDEVYYFTNRIFKEGGKAKAWAYKISCPKCKEGVMSKPTDSKTGKIKLRATEYVCNNCDNTMSKSEVEEIATLQSIYTCPACGKEGTYEGPYKRKSFKGVQSYVVVCEHCSEKIALTKKLKEIKKK